MAISQRQLVADTVEKVRFHGDRNFAEALMRSSENYAEDLVTN
jgi:hypothetical protein